ncbi:MAG TPA: ferritin-like domain-containing protein [Burkholderiales bacterium]|nr:ferritin-like domain-containing protein [Burkholderiales bacterium]
MQTTTEVGMNHSGILASEDAGEKMLQNIELTKPPRGDETDLAKIRLEYAKDAEPVGTLPEPQPEGVARVLMDKLGERLAFERSGTRLYDALMVKCAADKSAGVPAKELKHIRDEEAMHFALVGAAIESLGGDPTAQTPCADVTGVEGMGLMQVLNDPKTTLAQALHAILVAEMTDSVGWDELIELTMQVGNDDLVARFSKARDHEKEHLEKISGWYKAAVQGAANSDNLARKAR